MIGVENPCTGQADVIAGAGGCQVPAIAGHELDQQAPALLRSVHRISQGPAGIQVYMQIAVLLMTDRYDCSGHAAAGRQNTEPVRVVDAGKNVTRSVTGGRAMVSGPRPRFWFRFWNRGSRLRR